MFRKCPRNELFSLLYYKQLDLLVIEIGWMVLEIYGKGKSAKILHTIDNTGLSSIKIMRTTGANGVKNWWYTRSQSSRQSIYVLILTHMSVFPLANWSVQSPIDAHARLHLIRP